ncbi:LacI family DNA-binding transcriptional regulator [Pseudomonas sichuanensis]|uniref:LacI family DNA-binding transcriptional regulator n=1 Tax=Pseudomonas sichuanensis TaxID=2213015 RepID=UPI002446E195|nr:LacI family DNA-binding transcriptional regulator [Pseudomonas sichuanensis]MDH0730189.1 LacI family DNA-binding transcriptional regulator [Pseudomonas sichuanensis]MDH1581227.1 LacI family DNA-binding transcriptional regulator [Pseudomonas sichuanensis]MDH1593388.1 LacI family DNA-binding transcriptional regulator [Pseudomonas sichuanensis]MDH1597143.1 LacI family DNA-binding transcriptional regulator [Pseudomonas sichuanensis]
MAELLFVTGRFSVDRVDRRKGMADVALKAGVSLSTVDRVLNERGSVSDLKRRRVLQIAQELGLKRLLPSPQHGLLRFDLLLVDSTTDHFHRLAAAFSKQAQMHRSRLIVQTHVWPERNPDHLIDLIRNPKVPRQGIMVVAQDTTAVRRALKKQISAGVPVVMLTTSLSGLEGATYIGIDNNVVGRSAGKLMSQWVTTPGSDVVLLTNSLKYHAHQNRVEGFLKIMAEKAPQVKVHGPFECFDRDDLIVSTLAELYAKGLTIHGLYTTGSGSSGVKQALSNREVRPVWIGHEATKQHAEFLREGLLSLVLDQDPEGQAEAAIQHLLFANGDLSAPPQVRPQLRILIDEMVNG